MRDQTYFSKKVTFLNVVLTFLVVLLHSETPLRFGLPLDDTYPFIYLIFTLSQLGVPMFFFISAVLFYRACSFDSLENKYERRVRSLLIPYLIWNTFFVLVFVALTHIPFFQDRMRISPDLFNTPHKIINAIIHSKCTPLWFVKDLMLLTLMAPLTLLLLRDLRWLITALGLSLIVALRGNYSYENILVWIPLYLQGAIIGHYSFKSGKYVSADTFIKSRVPRVFLSIALLLILIALYARLYVDDGFIRFFRYCAPIIVWVLCDFVLKSVLEKRFVIKPWMSYMFIIYCMHHFILNVLQKIISLNTEPTRLILNATFVVTPVITVLFIIMLAKYMSRYSFYKYLSGGR